MDSALELRIFTPDGIAAFRKSIRQIKSGEAPNLPDALITDATLTRVVDESIYVELRTFDRTLDMVVYLHPIVKALTMPDKFYSQGLWSWLSAFYFDTLCPEDHGKRLIREEARYIPPTDGNWRDYYRHFIAAPLRLFDAHGYDRTLPLLSSSPHKWNDLYRLIVNSQERAMNSGILDAVGILFWNDKTAQIKRGALSHGKPGTVRRFIELMSQFDMTFDLQAMTGDQIVSLLPNAEFERWF